jgi:hypothetical protein
LLSESPSPPLFWGMPDDDEDGGAVDVAGGAVDVAGGGLACV